MWKNPPDALTPTTENFSVRLSKIIADKLKNPPLAEKIIVDGEPAKIPDKKIRVDRIINASVSLSRYSAATVTTFASPNFAPGGKITGGKRLSTANKISDSVTKSALTVNRRKSITRNLDQQLVRDAGNDFAAV